MNLLRGRLLLVAVWLPLAAGVSCDRGDSAPTLRLSDAGAGGCVGPESLEVPVAMGARLAVAVAGQGDAPSVSWAETADPQVISVVSVANPVILRASSVGSTVLEVGDTAEQTGEATLSVAEVASGALSLDPLLLFNLTVGLETPYTATAEGVLALGIALLPDGVLRISPDFLADGDVPLAGHDLAVWSAAPPVVGWTRPEPYSDAIDLRPNDGASGPVILRELSTGAAMNLTLLPPGSATSLTAYWPETGTLADVVTLAVGQVRTLVGVVRDDAARLVVGDDGDPFQVQAQGESVRIVPPPWSQGEGGVTLTEEITERLTTARASWIEGVYPGTTTLALSAAGRATVVTVTITE